MTATGAHSRPPARSRRRRLTVVALVALTGVLLVLAAGAPAAPAADESFVSPFVLAPLIGPWEQYGYAPDYVRYVPTFDSENRAYIRSRTSNANHTSYVHTLVDGPRLCLDFRTVLRAA